MLLSSVSDLLLWHAIVWGVSLPGCTSIWTGMQGEVPATSQPKSGALPCDGGPEPGSWTWTSHLPSLCLTYLLCEAGGEDTSKGPS